jgi:sterol-4alpha-carboxylate 3-dehydrogenase (decarboxylating)
MAEATATSLSPVLITGGCGFIAYHIISNLLANDPSYVIHALDLDISRNRVPSVIYHAGDISSASVVDRIMQEARPQVIFHLASPDSMVIQPKVFESVIVDGTRNLLSSAAKLGTVQALVYTSSSSVIHDNLTDLIDADENAPILRPPLQKKVYTLCKATAEEEILAANRSSGDRSMLTVVIRPALTFGERDTICLGKILAVAQQGKSKYQMGAGNNLYDFVYVGNLVDAHVLVAKALVQSYGKPPPEADKRVDGETFNVTNDERMSFWEFNHKIAATAGHPVRKEDIVVIPPAVGLWIGWISEWAVWLASGGTQQPNMTQEGIRFSTITRTLNGEKAKRVLGYRPRVGMDEAIVRSVKSFLNAN